MAQAVLQATDVAVVDNAVVVSNVVNNNNNNYDVQKRNRIQVSNTKKPLFFYLNLAKRYMKQHNDVELSALGMAIPTLVTIAEILKANGIAVEKKVLTSTVDSKDENKGRIVQKAKLEIFLEKNEKPVPQKTIAETTSTDTKAEANATAADEAKPENKSTADESKSEAKAATNDEKKEG
ncbi:hypothetical protein RND81_05G070000 [Saponaria officinalis]|uniref:DNA/RNA-binding protein Alba-like domain-containing protein n=1 Tax=Saponaria officinalis TaxID=3572 RepID=A0AAW1KQU8_SAPOF